MRQELLSHMLSVPADSQIRITEWTRGDESLVDHVNRRAVFSVCMNPHRGRAINSDGERDFFPGCGRTVGNNRVAGPCAPGVPGRTRRRADALESTFHHPSLPGRGDKPLRPLWLRVQRRHAPLPILTHSKTSSGFATRQFSCATHWLSREGLTGITKSLDMRYAQ